MVAVSFNAARRLSRTMRKDGNVHGVKSRRSWGLVKRGPGVTQRASNQPARKKKK